MEATRRAAEILDAGWPITPAAHRAFAALDEWLRAESHARNPGASADLIAVALFAALQDGTIALPLTAPWAGR